VAGGFPQRNVGLEVIRSLSLSPSLSPVFIPPLPWTRLKKVSGNPMKLVLRLSTGIVESIIDNQQDNKIHTNEHYSSTAGLPAAG